MSLSRNEIEKALKKWNLAWDNHDLEGVMELFHEEVVFDNWTGARVRGKEARVIVKCCVWHQAAIRFSITPSLNFMPLMTSPSRSG